LQQVSAAAAAVDAAAAADFCLPQAERLAYTPTDAGCLHCHAGFMQRRHRSLSRASVHEGVQVGASLCAIALRDDCSGVVMVILLLLLLLLLMAMTMMLMLVVMLYR
jgi:hypothetical protein